MSSSVVSVDAGVLLPVLAPAADLLQLDDLVVMIVSIGVAGAVESAPGAAVDREVHQHERHPDRL